MTISEVPKRLVVILACQIVGCLYCILAFGAFLKARHLGAPHVHLPIDDYAAWVKNLSWLLFLLPCIWFFFHVREWWKNGADWALLRNVVLSGVATFVAILFIAFYVTSVAMGIRRI